jgi:superfamily I DNA/RNA helicase
VARLAIAKGFLAEYAKLDKDARRAVEAVVTEFAARPHAWRYLEKPRQSLDDRIRLFRVNSLWRGVVLAPDTGDTYCLITILPHDKAYAYAAGHRFSVNQALGVLEARGEETIQPLRPFLQPAAEPDASVSGPQELPLILAHPFAAWRTFLHSSQREIAYRPSYAGPAQVTGGPGTGKTVTLLHRAAFLAARAAMPSEVGQPATAGQASRPGPGAAQILVTTFNGNLAEALHAQLGLLIRDAAVRSRVEVLNVDRLAYGVVKQARGHPVIADERVLRTRWAKAAADAGLAFTPAFGKNEWEQVILAQDLRTEQAYLACPRTGRGRPLTRAQRSLLWQATQRVTAELAAARESTHLQLANEATRLLRQAGEPCYRHILVDEAQDLHLAQWRLLRAAVAPGPDDLFIAADPHQRIYDSRVSLASLQINVRGRSRRLSLSYRTTQEILAWAVPLLGADPVVGLDGEVDSLLGYRSPIRGQRPQLEVAATRADEFAVLAERIRSWLSAGIEPRAIGVAARSASLVREAREALKADDIMTVPLRGFGVRSGTPAVRIGTMHAMKGLEFQAVAVIGVEQGLVPEPAAITPESEDAITHAQDLQRERCVLFAACTRARDHLFVSGTGAPSTFLPDDHPGAFT